MISLSKIKEELDTCKKPLFFYHDDADGLCSFLLLYRYIKEGKGVCIKASYGVDINFKRKVEEFKPDKIFITDLAVVTQEFLDAVKVPIIWIDHHPTEEKHSDVKYYNPRLKDKNKNIPATKICYDIVKQDLWIASVGTVGDWVYDKKLMKAFREKYPDLIDKKIKTPEGALFDSEIGKLARIFNFLLKGKISEINKCVKILTRIKSPYEILKQETSQGKYLYKKFVQNHEPYENLLKRALKVKSDDVFVFTYINDDSYTGELSNEVLYRKNKPVIICREKSGEMRCSLRSPKGINIRKILEKSLVNVEGRGGGHENACGASVKKEHWETFLENIKNELKK